MYAAYNLLATVSLFQGLNPSKEDAQNIQKQRPVQFEVHKLIPKSDHLKNRAFLCVGM